MSRAPARRNAALLARRSSAKTKRLPSICIATYTAADEIAKPEKQADPLARYGNQRTMENIGGVELADSRYEPFFARAEALNTLIFLHPIGFTDTRRLTQHFLTNIIGNPLDTTVALAHIVFGGVLERHPRLKIVVAHGGGYMGHYPARMDHAYKVRPECHDHIKRPPSYYMKKIYYDTMVFDQKQLEHLVNLWGADHVVIGTDYPYDMGYYKPVEFVNGTKSLMRSEREAILGGNATRLLGLKARAK
ncbi:MAG: amidohydrolase family protein [Burkholderiales bacterium]